MSEPSGTSVVVIPAAWADRLGEERVQELRQNGAFVEHVTEFNELELPPPTATEQVLGTLTDAETELFCQMYAAKAVVEDMTMEFMGGRIAKAQERLAQAGSVAGFIQQMHEAQGSGLSEEQAIELFPEMRRASMLHELFYWIVGQRMNCHDFALGVRAGRLIVKGARKW